MSLDRFRPHKRKMDYWLLFVVFVLCVFGTLMVYSSSAMISLQEYDVSNFYFRKQLLWFGIGIVFLIIFSTIDYRFWQKNALWLLLITIGLLILVFPFSTNISGAHRWIRIGDFTLQPSEVCKLTFILYLAAWLAKKGEGIKDFKYGFIPFIIIVAIIAYLIMKQPDMGTMSIIAFTAVAMFFVAGASLAHLGIGLVGVAGLFYLLIRSAPYRLQRFLVFLNPSGKELGAGYHINQALLAIGSGGILGLGFGNSKQKYLYLPESHTDSIFAIIVEELGFLRSSLVLLAFVLIAWRGYLIAKNAPDAFSQLTAAGITSWIVIQALVNLGAMLGILPLTGIPLPFISYGGSSLIVLMAGIGILLNISKQTTTK